MRKAAWILLPALLLTTPALGAGDPDIDAAALYQEHCAACHQPDRLGAVGPALLPENLRRLKKKHAFAVIKEGRPATQMEGVGEKLSDEQIQALVTFIYTPLPEVPTWDETEMLGTHKIENPVETLPAEPQHGADPLNLFTVVETGDHHVTILDGDKFEPLWRFQTHFALHGGAKYSPDGRFVYLASRDGWVNMYDLHSLQPVAEIRAGINTRNIAVSSDGKWIMVGNYLPHNLVVLDARTLKPVKVIRADNREGDKTSRISAVYNAPPRQSFIAALADFKEIWEMSYDPEADPVYVGFSHNYRKGQEEGIVEEKQPFARRRIKIADYMRDFFFDPYYAEVIGASRRGTNAMVYNLDARKKVADLELEGMPHLGSGIVFEYQGRLVMATPHLTGDMKEGKGTVSVIDMESWETIKKIPTKGPGFFMRSHEKTPYAWVDVFFGPHKDLLHVIDKRTLEIVKDINPAPGKTNAHVEFTRDGKYALVSIWEDDGALVVYDAETFEEVKRLPMKKPSGKYNVYNKITYSRGTSH